MTGRAPFSSAVLDSSQHDRDQFDCGKPALNRYLREQASQDVKKRASVCFVAVDANHRIAGFYTLAASSVPLPDIAHESKRKLPRYQAIPAFRLGRLAVDVAFAGQGLGSALLANALRRAVASDIPAPVVVVDAKDEAAADFYRHHGFIAMIDAPLTLMLPLAALHPPPPA